MAKVLITGGEGNLAKALAATTSSNEIILKSRKGLDVTQNEHIDELFAINADVIIHAAALTRPMVLHENDPWLSIHTNIIATAKLAMYCITDKRRLVYVSTDYVYPGITGMYKETDPVLPINYYAKSKYGGECAAQMVPDSLIVRCGFSETPFPHAYAFNDVHKSSLDIKEAARKIWNLINIQATGIYNIGGIRRTIFDFAIETNTKVLPISRKTIKEPIAIDCSMDTSKYDNAVS